MAHKIQLIGIDSSVGVTDIEKLFLTIGPVSRVSPPAFRSAVVQMEKDADAQRAVKELKGKRLGGETFSMILQVLSPTPEELRADTQTQDRFLTVLFQHRSKWTLVDKKLGPLHLGMRRQEIEAMIGRPTRELAWSKEWVGLRPPSQAHRAIWELLVYEDPEIETKISSARTLQAGIFPARSTEFSGLTAFVSKEQGLRAVEFFLGDVHPQIEGQDLMGMKNSEFAKIAPKSEFAVLSSDTSIGVSGTEIDDQKISAIFVADPHFLEENIPLVSKYASAKPIDRKSFENLMDSAAFDHFRRKATELKPMKVKKGSLLDNKILVGNSIQPAKNSPLKCSECGERLITVLSIPMPSGALQLLRCSAFEDCEASSEEDSAVLCFAKESELPSTLLGPDFRGYFFEEGKTFTELPVRSEWMAEQIQEVLEKQNEAPERITSYLKAALKINLETKDRNKIGGWPFWVQNDETPNCQKCQSHQFMNLIAQLIAQEEIDFGHDRGLIYFFQCQKHTDQYSWCWQCS